MKTPQPPPPLASPLGEAMISCGEVVDTTGAAK